MFAARALFATALALLLMPTTQTPGGANLQVYGYQIVRVYPHDPNAFTQGLQYVDGVFYEGTGQVGQSSIRKVDVESGKVLQQRDVPRPHFGEGITVWKDDLIELTWQTHVAFVYDRATFEPKKQFNYPGEGWGLTHDGTNLIMSDGTSELRVLDPTTFVEKRRIKVTAAGAPLRELNEVEFVKGEILANIWQTDYIARIAPDTGKVAGYIDLRGLLSPAERAKTDVLNGIAYDAERDRLFVTGKWWPKLFEIRIVKKAHSRVPVSFEPPPTRPAGLRDPPDLRAPGQPERPDFTNSSLGAVRGESPRPLFVGTGPSAGPSRHATGRARR